MALARLRRDIVRVWRKLSGAKARARAAAFAEFDAALRALRPDDLAIDLGANAGIFTLKMAATGAQVIAFEPDPHAFALLAASTATCDNVRRVQAAAGAQAGVFQLYRHADFDTAPDRHTTSSSLIADKRNVSAASAVDVEVVDFIAYLVALNRDVALLKIDIEGAEVELLERLLPHPVAQRIAKIFVETHERGLPHLAQRTDALKARAALGQKPSINWDWH